MDKKITIVYYGYINPNVDWWNIMGGQLESLKATGILEKADLCIHITGQDHHTREAMSRIKSLIPQSNLSVSYDNQYEYPAIHWLWELAKQRPDNIFLYFHTKGMSYNVSYRVSQELQLFQEVIVPWQKVISVFENPAVNKVGFTASEAGWMWFNFWWARGSYLASCEEPKLTPLRHYYEDWLHRKTTDEPKNSHDCYSLADDKIGNFYSPAEACGKLDAIPIKQMA